jgi:hypothetical protein
MKNRNGQKLNCRIENDELIPEERAIRGRVTAHYILNTDEKVELEQITEIYFDFWGDKNAFYMTSRDERIGLEVQVRGVGAAQGTTIPITGIGSEPSASFRLEGVTYGEGIDFNRSTEPEGEIFFRFIEDAGDIKRVEGQFSFSLNYGRPGEDFYSLAVRFVCTQFNVTSRPYPS